MGKNKKRRSSHLPEKKNVSSWTGIPLHRMAAAFFMIIALCCAYSSLKVKSITYDEGNYLAVSEKYDVSIINIQMDPNEISHGNSQDRTKRIAFYEKYRPLFHPPLMYLIQKHLSFAKSFFQQHSALHQARALMLFILFPILGYCVYQWSKNLYGKTSALLSLGFFCLSPNLLAHSRLLTPDFILTTFFCLSAFVFWRFFKSPTISTGAILGVCLGLAMISKYTALILYPIVFIQFILALWTFPDFAPPSVINIPIGSFNIKRWIDGAFCYVLMVLISIAIIAIAYHFDGVFSFKTNMAQASSPLFRFAGTFWPGKLFFSLFPAPYIDGVLLQTAFAKNGFQSYLLGVHSNKGWWYYFIVAFFIKTPIATLLLFFLTFGITVKGLRKYREEIIFLILPPLLLFTYMSLFNRIDIGLRYVLPIYPFMMILIGKTATLIQRKNIMAQLVLAGILIWYVAASFWIYPDYLAYFNESIGGPINGSKYLIDSNLDWGQDTERFRAYYIKQRGRLRLLQNQDPGPYRGRVTIDVNTYRGLGGKDRSMFEWLDDYQPVDHIGYTWLIYDIP